MPALCLPCRASLGLRLNEALLADRKVVRVSLSSVWQAWSGMPRHASVASADRHVGLHVRYGAATRAATVNLIDRDGKRAYLPRIARRCSLAAASLT